MIDSKLHNELHNRYNPEGSKMRDYQIRLLDTLIEFDKVCKKHDIKYWIASGTLLGAKRHGGFIPWDDDMDIEIPYKEYQKLISVFKENEKIVIQTAENDKYYPHHFPKIRDKNSEMYEVRGLKSYKYNGAFIDLFVIEDTFELPARVLFWSVIIQMKLMKAKLPYSFVRNAIILTLKKTTLWLQYAIRFILKRIPGKHLGYCYGSPFYRNRLYKEDYLSIGEIEFEGHKFPCPGNVDQYLEHMYGDWNTLPDLTKLHPHLAEFKVF